MSVRAWYKKAQVYYFLVTLLVASIGYSGELVLKEFEPSLCFQKANKHTKNKTEKELCLDKCTHPKPRDMKCCWAQTRWHFQLTEGFDICSPVTLAERWIYGPSLEVTDPQQLAAETGCSCQHRIHQLCWLPCWLWFKAKPGDLRAEAEGESSVASAEGKWAITPAGRGGRCRTAQSIFSHVVHLLNED